MSSAEDKSAEEVLRELDALSHSLFQAHTARRTASLALPRSAVPAVDTADRAGDTRAETRPRSRRLSMSPWRSRPKQEEEAPSEQSSRRGAPQKTLSMASGTDAAAGGEKKGIWNWKPMRALSHIGMNRLGCLFSVEVVAVHGLPPSMNGLRLSVSVRKKETRDGAVQTMPVRVLQGAADFEETLFIRCHVYCAGGGGTGKPLKFEPRPFIIAAIAVDAPELDLGRSAVDLSALVKDSLEKNAEGGRIRQWDTSFLLAGKAKGAELVVKLGFQIMEDGAAAGVYSQAERSGKSGWPSARKQNKSSFSVTSPRVTRSEPPFTPTRALQAADVKEIDEFNLDDSVVRRDNSKMEQLPETNDELELPEFDVVDKGLEIQEGEENKAAGGGTDEASGEVVKEVVHDSAHWTRLSELETIANQIKALESMMIGDADVDAAVAAKEEDGARLGAEEETVTREFLQMLEQDEGTEAKLASAGANSLKSAAGKAGAYADTTVYVSDLGKGLGPVVQTRSGGFLAAMNPFDIPVLRKETPKLAMQLSRPLILTDPKIAAAGNIVEVFQQFFASGTDELCAKLSAVAALDELTGKTAEQIAFEGMATVIITGRSTEVGTASSSAARSVATLRTLGAAMSEGRKERIATGIWNIGEEPVTADEIVAVSLQKLEVMVVEALKIQAGMTDEPAPFDVPPEAAVAGDKHPLDSAVPVEEWSATGDGKPMVFLVVQLRDPQRRYETVGAPSMVIIQAARAAGKEENFKVVSMHVAGIRLRSGARRSIWDGEKQRLTAMQWLMAYGVGKPGKKGRAAAPASDDVLWSATSRVMADMWLRAMRNPDVRVPHNWQPT